MKLFPGQSPDSSSWRLAVPAGVAVVLLAAGIAFGAYFASQAIDGTSVAQETEEPTAVAPAADSSPTAAVTAEPSPEPTTSPTTPASTRGALGCPDCAVKGRDQLEVTAEDIQLGPDGKYYIPDRGDGCAYRETGRALFRGVEEVALWAPGCEEGRIYEAATGRVRVVIP
jgi:hypothetical protein